MDADYVWENTGARTPVSPLNNIYHPRNGIADRTPAMNRQNTDTRTVIANNRNEHK